MATSLNKSSVFEARYGLRRLRVVVESTSLRKHNSQWEKNSGQEEGTQSKDHGTLLGKRKVSAFLLFLADVLGDDTQVARTSVDVAGHSSSREADSRAKTKKM